MADIKFSEGSKDFAAPAVQLYARAFREDPVIIYMLCNLTEEQRLVYLESWFNSLITAAVLNKAKIEEANDWASACTWMPPRKRVDNPWTMPRSGLFAVLWNLGLKGCKRMLLDFQSQANAYKKKTLQGRDYYYMFLMATEKEHRGKGLAKALIRRQQEVIKKDNPLPIWTEATTENSMRVYASCGFKTVGQFKVGEGVAGSDGKVKKGGEGVTLWAMVWEPKTESSA